MHSNYTYIHALQVKTKVCYLKFNIVTNSICYFHLAKYLKPACNQVFQLHLLLPQGGVNSPNCASVQNF